MANRPPPRPPPPRKKGKTTIVAETRITAAVMRAQQLYLQDPDSSVNSCHRSKMTDDPEDPTLVSDHVGLSWLRTQAAEQKWAARRDEMWARIRQRISMKVEEDITQRTLREITALESVREKAYDYLLGNEDAKIAPVAPKSFEGVADALVKIDRVVTEKRGHVAQAVGIASASGSGGTAAPDLKMIPQVEDGLTEAEILAMARAVTVGRAAAPIALAGGEGAVPDDGDDGDTEEE